MFFYDPLNDSYRVNEVRTGADLRAVNRCLAIVGAGRRVNELATATPPPVDSDGVTIPRALTVVWVHPRRGTYAEPSFTCFTPREEFSGPTDVSLSTAAGRAAHEEALNG